jgi:Domain of unknown function (DUF4157)
MAFALLSRPGSKPQGSVKPVAKRKPAGVQPLHGNPPVLQTQDFGRPLAPAVPLRPGQSGIPQRKCACGSSAGMSGECAECSKKKRVGLQTKLQISEPGDSYEQEADRIADQVRAAPAPHAVSTAVPCIQRLAGQAADQGEAAPASVDRALASPGKPLEPALRQDMEQRFGYDFSRVRVHCDAAAERSARDVNAHAYTVGHDLVFGAGRLAPGTYQGRRLLVHELTHVVQQVGSDATRLDQSNENRGLSAIPTRPKLQRQPAGCDVCRLRPADELEPDAWYRCMRKGCIQEHNADPLRFAKNGRVATRDELGAWVAREGISQERAIADVMHGYDFLGTTKAREDAKVRLITVFPVEKLSVCIRPVQIADDNGKNPTVLPSFDAAKTIWGKCCVDLSVKGAKTVSKTAFKTLDHEPDTSKATAEEASLFRAAGGAGDCISVFVAETFQQGGKTSKDIGGGAATFGTPDGGSAVFVVEGADPTIIAHELGHAMGLGPLDHGPAGTIMEVLSSRHDQKESDKVAKVICDKVRTFTNAKPGGKKDCYLDIIK